MRTPIFRVAFAVLTLAAPVRSQSPETAEYAVLDRVEGSFVNLNLVPVRPMVVRGGDEGESTDLYVVNTPNNTVEHFVDDSNVPAVHPVPWGPVSIAWWDGDPNAPEDDPELLVVCAGSDVLVTMTPGGAFRAVIALPAEPADIVVDESTEHAFVSCSGTDEVVRVDLVTRQVSDRYSEATTPGLRLKHPLFLALDDEGRVIVSPMLSGNGTLAHHDTDGVENPNGRLAADVVADLSGNTLPDETLPDEDLFRIDPVTGTAQAVATGVGAVQFGNGFNPFDGRFWQLNTKARNADPALPTEPALKGVFASNHATIVDLSGSAGAHQDLDLDRLLDPSGQTVDPSRTVGQPYAITFAANGVAFVAGLLTDNVMLIRSSGVGLVEWDLPDGSIPRGLHLNADKTGLWVYCSGTNEVRVHHPLGAFVRSHALSHDPTPAPVRRGRELFYDASLSLNNNLSCATCHVEGGSDLLVWDLSAGPSDEKGPMLTQTLRGIEATQPLHWRGERAHLSDFRGAFAGLLGGAVDATSPSFDDAFADFRAFVFSLQNRSNPFQSRDRVLDDAIQPPVANAPGSARATEGQTAWFEEKVFLGEQTCNDCHSMPKGTLNDIYPDVSAGHLPKRGSFKIASFQEIWRRQQSIVALSKSVTGLVSPDPVDERAFLGSGLSHAGMVPDFHTFVKLVSNFLGQNPAIHDAISALGHQWDQGLAPAAQSAARMTPANANDVRAYLLAQVAARNCGIAVYGEHLVGSGPLLARRAWFYDRNAGLFRSEDPADGTRTFQDFIANLGVETSVFVGWPLGMAEGMSIDRDLDGVPNLVDPQPLVAAVDPADQTPPQFLLNAPRTLWVPWKTAKVARLIFETDEYTTASIVVDDGAQVRTIEPVGYSKLHSVLLTHLRPDPDGTSPVPHSVTVTVTDRAGNQQTYAHAGLFETEPFTLGSRESRQLVVEDLHWTAASVVGGNFVGAARITIREKRDPFSTSPVANGVAVFRVVTDEPAAVLDAYTTTGATVADGVRITYGGGSRLLGLDGPFLVSAPTDASGVADVDFTLPGPFGVGTTLTLSLEAVVQHDPQAGGPTLDCGGGPCVFEIPVPPSGAIPSKDRWMQWSFPDTEPAFRALHFDL
ncbi:MAG: cytochrome c peroxidase [Planctomycetota bacterium JB042]